MIYLIGLFVVAVIGFFFWLCAFVDEQMEGY